MVILTRSIMVLSVATVVVAPGWSLAQTQADVDACNEQAKASAVNPSALPGTSGGGSTMTSPGSSGANREPNVTGRISGSGGSPGTGAGTTGISEVSPREPISGPDVQLRGMAAAGRVDAAYREAYRDCMKSRGF